MLPDNNTLKRQSLARIASQVFSREFTEPFTINGRDVAACKGELSEADKLEIAGREILRAESVSVLASVIAGITWDEGDDVILSGDTGWAIKSWKISPDGAVVTFLLFDSA